MGYIENQQRILDSINASMATFHNALAETINYNFSDLARPFECASLEFQQAFSAYTLHMPLITDPFRDLTEQLQAISSNLTATLTECFQESFSRLSSSLERENIFLLRGVAFNNDSVEIPEDTLSAISEAVNIPEETKFTFSNGERKHFLTLKEFLLNVLFPLLLVLMQMGKQDYQKEQLIVLERILEVVEDSRECIKPSPESLSTATPVPVEDGDIGSIPSD